jgi:hypothetical protein
MHGRYTPYRTQRTYYNMYLAFLESRLSTVHTREQPMGVSVHDVKQGKVWKGQGKQGTGIRGNLRFVFAMNRNRARVGTGTGSLGMGMGAELLGGIIGHGGCRWICAVGLDGV